MAVSPSPPVTLETKPDVSESENPNLPSTQPDPSAPSPSPAPAPASAPAPAPTPVAVPPIPLPVSVPFPISSTPAPSETPNSNPPLTSTTTTPPPPPLSYPSFTPPTIPISIPPSAPSFRPITPIPPPAQYTPLPNPNFQNPNFQNPNPGLQPPGVNPIMIPGPATGAGAVTVSVPQLRPPGMYQVPPPGQPLTYGQVPNGYAAVPNQAPQGTIPPPGIARYLPPPHYSTMGRPTFIRPPMGVLPPLTRPPMQGIRPAMPPPGVRPPVPIVAPTEKPQTTVYVGKIAPTVDNEFILSLLRLCGPVKIWKRAQDPSDGTPRGFGFCEFESAEGVLRALRLLTKCNVDGLEMVLNVNQATREYLERYVEKKKEREKLKEAEAEGTKKEEESAPGVEKNEPPKTATEDSKEENDKVNKEIQDAQNFGIVSDEDREADQEALEKLSNMLEERLKNRPLPPPPPPPIADGAAKSNSEAPTKSRDGDSDVDIMRNGDDKIDDETTSENKPISEHDRPETSSPDRIRRYDRRSRDRDRDRDRDNRDRDRERDLKRDKERELERYEKERERERIRRERDRENKIREAERLYKERVKEWENRERDKEYQRQQEREKEKERERQRKREVTDQEYDSDDDDRRRRRRSNVVEEKRKRRRREKEEDLVDAKREAEEVAEAKRRAIEEEQQKKDEPKDLPAPMANGSEKSVLGEENNVDGGSDVATQAYESDDTSDVIMKNGVDDLSLPAVTLSNAPAKKLGFGLIGSGKRTTVPSVFHEEDEDEADKDKKMRPLVPIDYSTEEIQAVQVSASGAPPANLAAAAEFAKRISNVNPKEERSDIEKDRSRRSGDRSSHRDRDRNDDDSHRTRDENKERFHDRDRERDREHVADKLKTPENKKLLDAKQLIDMIPKTKEELFSYEINWAVYDKHELHERMRPWISKKITEFLGEEEATLVDYIVSSTKEHVRASQMLELLQSILDDEAEMFVLKMWRMLIFEIKKVETGLALKSKAEK